MSVVTVLRHRSVPRSAIGMRALMGLLSSGGRARGVLYELRLPLQSLIHMLLVLMCHGCIVHARIVSTLHATFWRRHAALHHRLKWSVQVHILRCSLRRPHLLHQTGRLSQWPPAPHAISR